MPDFDSGTYMAHCISASTRSKQYLYQHTITIIQHIHIRLLPSTYDIRIAYILLVSIYR